MRNYIKIILKAMMGGSASSQQQVQLLDIEDWSVRQLESLLFSQQVMDYRDCKGQHTSLVDLVKKRVSTPLSLVLVRRDIKEIIHAPSHDDGSYGPLFIRLAWHTSGTWDKKRKNGGSNGCTLRFPVERADPENAGLGKAIEVLTPVHEKYSFLSFADLIILAGCVAIEWSGGPKVPFSYGRADFSEQEALQIYGTKLCPFGDGVHSSHASRLPEADRACRRCTKRVSDACEGEAYHRWRQGCV
mmetsp:Transcript_12209/g.25008  ORF Transcript_12209/g.25008 Transcript_12209/m.25008 type:complete len:244 (+) Transcript_12209:1204-1935(+)